MNVSTPCDEAATELASLRERVKELEVERDGFMRVALDRLDKQTKAESRAARLQQERDEAVERLRPFAEGSLDIAGAAIIIGFPSAESTLKSARDFIRQLAAGKEKGK